MGELPIDQFVGNTVENHYREKFKAEADRLTKDLEDMLTRIIDRATSENHCRFCYVQSEGGLVHYDDACLVVEAKALLERTGYTEGF